MNIEIYDTSQTLGKAAAKNAAQLINAAIKKKERQTLFLQQEQVSLKH